MGFHPMARRGTRIAALACAWAAMQALSAGRAGAASFPAAPPATDVRQGLRDALVYLRAAQVAEDRATPSLRLRGEWPSYAGSGRFHDERLSAIYDSNAFVPMGIATALLAVDDSALPAPARHVSAMQREAFALLRRHYASANGAVNFWPRLGAWHGPIQILQKIPFMRLGASLYDIADDADDTAVFHALAARLARRGIVTPMPPLPALAPLLERWRDVDRVRADPREVVWKRPATGAYLTWLSDEDKPHNKQPVPFLLPNNVDCVVVANALYAMSVDRWANGGPETPGQAASCRLLRHVIRAKLYPRCALYYPSPWHLPYVASRAWAAGKASCLAQGETASEASPLAALAATLVSRQSPDGSWTDQAPPAERPADVVPRAERFPEEDGKVLATAYAVIALQNMRGAPGVDDAASAKAIGAGLAYILAHEARDAESAGRHWRGGVFFTASFQDVSRWTSPAYTTALALEAFAQALAPRTPGHDPHAPLALEAADVVSPARPTTTP